MKRKFFQVTAIFAAALILSVPYSSRGEAGQSAREIIVAVGSASNPIGYIDVKGEIKGYDPAVLRAVDDLLQQYTFKFEATEMKNILVGLEVGQYDIGAHIFTWTQERANTFVVGSRPYGSHNYGLAVVKGRKDIQSFRDLEGKKVITDTGSAESFYLNKYNEEAAKTPIEIVFGEVTTDAVVKGLLEGRYDVKIAQMSTFKRYLSAYPDSLERVGKDNIIPGYYYHYFAKGQEQLRDDVDAAIQQLKDSGRLRELSIEYLGDDYTLNEDIKDPGHWEY
jgi:L-cystine transport system substrate-binding protein